MVKSIKLENLAGSQWGMFTAAQACDLGVSRNQIAHQVDAHRIEPICYGVYRYCVDKQTSNPNIKAAWLSIFPKKKAEDRLRQQPYDAVVAGKTAANMLGIQDFSASPYTFAVRQRKQSVRDDLSFLSREVDEHDVVIIDGLPVTSFERTIYDLVRSREDSQLVDKFIKDVSSKTDHLFDQKRLSELLVPLAARNGFKKLDGDSFAADLLSRNAVDPQLIRAGRNIASAMQVVASQEGIARMGEQLRDISNMLGVSDIFKNCSEAIREIQESQVSNEVLESFRETLSNVTLPSISAFSELESMRKAVEELDASYSGLWSQMKPQLEEAVNAQTTLQAKKMSESMTQSLQSLDTLADVVNFPSLPDEKPPDMFAPFNGMSELATNIPTPDFRSSWHQLIILGNGFDLECGLESRFADFFKPREQLLEGWLCTQPDEHVRSVKKMIDSGLTAWDLILVHDFENDWCDIEAEIAAWVLNEVDESGTGHLDSTLDAINGRHILFGSDGPVGIRYSETDYTYPCVNVDVADYFLVATSDALKRNFDKAELLDFLMIELCKLEKQFMEYLSSKVSDETYQHNCNELFYKILNDDLPDDEDFVIEHSVLDFNYTKPCWDSTPRNDAQIINIHGHLEGDIIIGIDGKDHLIDPLVAPFTKTYRLLSTARQPIGELIRTANRSGEEGTSVIKFYGHSLSEADYSYFQSIFDGVNLYGGATQLVFFYRPYKPNARQSLVDSVMNLLNTYGDTLENKDHGKNLVHKLLLEGRLSIREI